MRKSEARFLQVVSELKELERNARARAAELDAQKNKLIESASKRIVDGVIMPIAPSAAVEEGLFTYYSMTMLST